MSGPALIDQVVAADREWFERHRSERHRVRSYVRDEFDRHEDAWESVVVTAIRSPREIGLRHRLVGGGDVPVLHQPESGRRRDPDYVVGAGDRCGS